MECYVFWMCIAIIANLVSFTGCSPARRFKTARIVGGREAVKGAYPWQVSIRYRYAPDDTDVTCGGSIIADQWVVTAAHCFEGPGFSEPSRFFIVAGEHNQKIEEGTEQRHNIKKIIMHADFDEDSGQNDVSLMKLVGKLTFNEFVRPIPLATPDLYDIERRRNIHCEATGWGHEEFDGKITDILRTIDMPLLPLEVCKDMYSGETFTEDMLCTGHTTGDKAPCNGDSGGPLACIVNGKWILAAVGSWGEKCGTPGFPVIFTRMSFFYNWIKDKTARES